jgi:hypothetical protein
MTNLPTRTYTVRANEFIEKMGFDPDQYTKKFAKNSVIVIYASIVDGKAKLCQEKFSDDDPKSTTEPSQGCKVIINGRPRAFPSKKTALDWIQKAMTDGPYPSDSPEYKSLARIFEKAIADPRLSVLDDS